MKLKLIRFALALFVIPIFGLGQNVIAQKSRDLALVFKSKGSVEVKESEATAWQQSRRGKRLDDGDDIRTGSNAFAALVFTDDKSLMRVWKNSNVTIRGEREEKTIKKRIRMEFGGLFINAKKQKSPFIVETPSGVAAVRGTAAYFILTGGRLLTIVLLDSVEIANTLQQLLSGQGAMVTEGNTGITDGQSTLEVETTTGPLPFEAEGIREIRLRFNTPNGSNDLIIKYVEI
jgi:ferric-dicitrate binding protein FerR (iron transport regulator)